jgi:hypothetical protein
MNPTMLETEVKLKEANEMIGKQQELNKKLEIVDQSAAIGIKIKGIAEKKEEKAEPDDHNPRLNSLIETNKSTVK